MGGKYIQEKEFSSGFLHLPPNTRKIRETAMTPEVFYVVDGGDGAVEFELWLNADRQTKARTTNAHTCTRVCTQSAYTCANTTSNTHIHPRTPAVPIICR